jgi:hypothetical protein
MIAKHCSIVEGTARPMWFPVSAVGGAAKTVYVGGLVTHYIVAGDGVLAPIAANANPMGVPFGVVLGTNNLVPLYDTTYNAEYQISTITLATSAAVEKRMQEGQWIKGDTQAMVQVAVIDPTSVLRLPIYAHATTQTAPTEAISTAGNANGLTVTCGTTGFDCTGIAYNAMYYCRKGLNQGIYRTGYDTNAGTGAKTFYIPTPFTTATTGEIWVGANFSLGRQRIDLQTTGLGINTVTTTSTNHYLVDVLEINLKNKGEEYALLRFVF